MRTGYTVVLSMLAGATLGAAAVQGLHAQGKGPVYQISEIDVVDGPAYIKEYAPRGKVVIQDHGGRFVALGGKTTTVEGDPPKGRVAIIAWDSMEKLQGYLDSPAYKEVKPIRDKYAKVRTFAVEGLAN